MKLLSVMTLGYIYEPKPKGGVPLPLGSTATKNLKILKKKKQQIGKKTGFLKILKLKSQKINTFLGKQKTGF